MYDSIVVGAGVVGSATAYHLAKRTKSVLLLDQVRSPKSPPQIKATILFHRLLIPRWEFFCVA